VIHKRNNTGWWENNTLSSLDSVMVWIWNVLHSLMYWGLGCQLTGFGGCNRILRALET
jgi:hypothetical protein